MTRAARLLAHLGVGFLATLGGCLGGGEDTSEVLPTATAGSTRFIRIHYPAAWGDSLSIRGDTAPLSWTVGVPLMWSTGDVWQWPIPNTLATFHFKPLLNDSMWSVGVNYTAPANSSIDIYPFFGPSTGSLVLHTGFTSPAFGNTRSIRVYLPPSYSENTLKQYPVLYMHDGQNLFQSSTSFGGVEWGVDEALNALIAAGSVQEVIVVGIHNTSARIAEYTPTSDPNYGGGFADLYLDFIESTVMPFINATYRTLTGPAHTAMLGSSLGGLASFYAGWMRSSVYGTIGAMSPSFWWDAEALTDSVEQFSGSRPPLRIYLDEGGQEPIGATVSRMRDALETLGYTHGIDLAHWFDPTGQHTEASWSQRLPIVLPFIVGHDL